MKQPFLSAYDDSASTSEKAEDSNIDSAEVSNDMLELSRFFINYVPANIHVDRHARMYEAHGIVATASVKFATQKARHDGTNFKRISRPVTLYNLPSQVIETILHDFNKRALRKNSTVFYDMASYGALFDNYKIWQEIDDELDRDDEFIEDYRNNDAQSSSLGKNSTKSIENTGNSSNLAFTAISDANTPRSLILALSQDYQKATEFLESQETKLVLLDCRSCEGIAAIILVIPLIMSVIGAATFSTLIGLSQVLDFNSSEQIGYGVGAGVAALIFLLVLIIEFALCVRKVKGSQIKFGEQVDLRTHVMARNSMTSNFEFDMSHTVKPERRT